MLYQFLKIYSEKASCNNAKNLNELLDCFIRNETNPVIPLTEIPTIQAILLLKARHSDKINLFVFSGSIFKRKSEIDNFQKTLYNEKYPVCAIILPFLTFDEILTCPKFKLERTYTSFSQVSEYTPDYFFIYDGKEGYFYSIRKKIALNAQDYIDLNKINFKKLKT